MKKSTKAVSLMLGALMAFTGFAACGKKGGKPQVDEKTIVIKCRRAGFGTDWLYELKGQFERVYATEGYKVHIMTPDNNIKDGTLVNELYLGYDTTGVDLYISSGVTPDQVGELGDYGILAEEIGEEVYGKPAISYDGTEEEVLISDKISADVLPYMTDSTGKIYAYNWASTAGGLVVNTRKLARYGLELPKTTNEMFDAFNKIFLGHNGQPGSYDSGTYPITYVAGTNGYGLVFLYTMIAQYEEGFYDKFWSFQEEVEGEKVNLSDADAQQLYAHPAVEEMLTVAYQTFDINLSAPGSNKSSVDQAQAKVMGDTDDAVFMFNGDWMLNEVKLNYPSKLNDIDFINFPVVSALGTKLFGAGTAHNLSAEQCDALLSYIIGLVDENKSIEEIVAAVQANKGITISNAEAADVARARGVTYSRGVEHVAYVTKNTTKMDIVSLFLRMMSSDDFGETFLKSANGSSPYYASENTNSDYKFVRNASKIASNRYFSLVSTFGGPRGYRKQLGLTSFFTTVGHIPSNITTNSKASIFDEDTGKLNGNSVQVYRDAAKTAIRSEINNLAANWATYKEIAGLK